MKRNLFALPSGDLDHVLTLAQADLEALRDRHLFITGGTGFFGKWLLGALVHANDTLGLHLRLTVLSRDPAAFVRDHPDVNKMAGLRFLRGHVADFSADEEHYDYVLHAAADTTAFSTPEEEEERSRAIVDGTRRMIALARQCGAQRLLNVSSGAVYGAAAGKTTGATEDDYATAFPVTPYAAAKRAAEQLCADDGIDFTTARAFAFLGPHLALDAHFAAGNFLRDALKGGPILVRGDGTALRSYLHPADLVVWLLRILVRGERGRAYNVGSDEVVSTAQLARLIAEAVQPVPEVIVQSVQPQGPQNIYLPDITRARRGLQLDVAIPLREAIDRTLAFLGYRASVGGGQISAQGTEVAD